MRLFPRASSGTMRPTTIGASALAAALLLVAGATLMATSADGSSDSDPVTSSGAARSTSTSSRAAGSTSSITGVPTTSTTVAPVEVLPARVFASGNAQLDALLTTLPEVLFEGGAQVHAGYNPVDCCHAGGYNPEPNEVWVGDTAFASPASLTYVAAHELAHSVHLNSARADALTTAVAGAPVVRAGSPWDDSEKVADCVAWALYPAETAASGLTYWDCPDPYRTQVAAALR
jgi:hypothetical protein